MAWLVRLVLSLRAVAADSGRGRCMTMAIKPSYCAFTATCVGGIEQEAETQLSGKTFLRPGSSETGPGQGVAKRGLMWTRTPRSVSRLTAFVCHQLNSKLYFFFARVESGSFMCGNPPYWLLSTRYVGRGAAECPGAHCLTRRPAL